MKLFYEDVRDSADHIVDCDPCWRPASDEMVLKAAFEIVAKRLDTLASLQGWLYRQK